jgi:transketolase C-terminal domain/subunit
MRCIPNMHVLECGNATEVESVLDVAEEIKGPRGKQQNRQTPQAAAGAIALTAIEYVL